MEANSTRQPSALRASLDQETEEYTPRDRDAVISKWQQAIEQCRESLKPKWQLLLDRFDTPAKLEADLRARQEESSERAKVERFLAQIYPTLKTVQNVSFLFVTSVSPVRIEIGILFGLLGLTVVGAFNYMERLEKVVDTLDAFRTALHEFSTFATDLDSATVRNALVRMFVSMIKFWVSAVELLEKESSLNPLSELDKGFEKARNDVEAAVARVRRIADHDRHLNAPTQTEEAIRKVMAAEEAGADFPLFCVSGGASNFVGRAQEIERIRNHLETQDLASKCPTVVSIWGIGGVGKTSLSINYAEDANSRNVYDATLIVRAQSPDTLRKSYTAIAMELNLPGATANDDSDENIFRVKNWFIKTRRRWLLIFDNIEEGGDLLIKHIPALLDKPTGSAVIVTTRFRDVAVTKTRKNCLPVELGPLREAESIQLMDDLLRKHNAGGKFDDEIRKRDSLLAELAGHPIGIELLAAYIGENEYSANEVYDKFTRMNWRMLQQKGGSAHSLPKIWELQFQAIQQQDAAILLAIMSIMEADQIPEELFTGFADRSTDTPLTGRFNFLHYHDELEAGLGTLTKLTLVKRRGQFLFVHRLIQAAYRESCFGLSQQYQEVCDAAAMMILYCFPKKPGSTSHVGRYQQCYDYLPHALRLIDYMYQARHTRRPVTSSEDLMTLMQHATWFLYEIGELTSCLKYVEMAKELCSDQLCFRFGQYCNTAACVWYEMNNLVEDRNNIEKCLAIYQKELAPGDPHLGHVYRNEGLLLFSERRYAEALESFAKADAISPNNDPYHAGLNRMLTGRVRFVMGDLDRAKTDYETGLECFKTGRLERSLFAASIIYAQGNLEQALAAKADAVAQRSHMLNAWAKYSTALDICLGLGKTQIFLASIYYQMAVTKAQLGDIKTAIIYFDYGLALAMAKEMDSHTARLSWKKATWLQRLEVPTPAQEEEAKKLDFHAASLRLKISMELGQDLRAANDDEAYDQLICGYHR